MIQLHAAFATLIQDGILAASHETCEKQAKYLTLSLLLRIGGVALTALACMACFKALFTLTFATSTLASAGSVIVFLGNTLGFALARDFWIIGSNIANEHRPVPILHKVGRVILTPIKMIERASHTASELPPFFYGTFTLRAFNLLKTL